MPARTVVENPPPLTPRGKHPVRPFPFSWLRQFSGITRLVAISPAREEEKNPLRYE